MGKDKRDINIRVVLCILVGALLLLSLVPLLYIAKYDLPHNDDMQSYQGGTAQIWAETHSVAAVIKTAVDKTVFYYNDWQGTYFASFLMYLVPCALPITAYGLTPYIMLSALIFSTLFAGYALIVRQFRLSRSDWLLISLTALLFQIQIMPDIKEGIFWLSSAVLYLLSYCCLLLIVAFLQIARTARSGFVRVLTSVLAVLLSAALAGGAFMLLIPAILILAYLLFRDIASREKRHIALTSAVLLVLVLGTILSTTAPGNQLRMQYEHSHYGSHGLSFVMATLQSVSSGIFFIGKHSGFEVLLFSGICAAAFYPADRRTESRYYSPILVLAATFALFCMQFFPTLYSLASPGAVRQENIIYFSLYWLYAVNTVNLVGWLVQKHRSDLFIDEWENAFKKKNASLVRLLRGAVLTALIVLTFFAFAQREGGLFANHSMVAVTEVRTGLARDYYQQKIARMQGEESAEEPLTSRILP